MLDIKKFDRDTGKEIVIDPSDTVNLNKKTIVHEACGQKHIDDGVFMTFNHQKHLCLHCNEYFRDDERGIGV